MRNKIEKLDKIGRKRLQKVRKSWNEEKVPVDKSGAIHNVRNPIKYEEKFEKNKKKREKLRKS